MTRPPIRQFSSVRAETQFDSRTLQPAVRTRQKHKTQFSPPPLFYFTHAEQGEDPHPLSLRPVPWFYKNNPFTVTPFLKYKLIYLCRETKR